MKITENFRVVLMAAMILALFTISFLNTEVAGNWSAMVIPVVVALYLAPSWKTAFALMTTVVLANLVSGGANLLTAVLYDVPLILFLTILNVKTNLKQIIDPLTKAYNRSFYNAFTSKTKNLKDLSIQVLDIDHFKRINDTYGHNGGDYVLSEIVKVIKSNIRKEDLICRYGGEEFAILSPNTCKKESSHLAERVCKAISETTFEFEGQIIPVTVSIGVATQAETKTAPAAKLFELADQALYLAKTGGRNRVQFAISAA